jgi:hypothetical protein
MLGVKNLNMRKLYISTNVLVQGKEGAEELSRIKRLKRLENKRDRTSTKNILREYEYQFNQDKELYNARET